MRQRSVFQTDINVPLGENVDAYPYRRVKRRDRVIADQLRQAGDEVAALVRDPGKARRLRDLGVELVRGDMADSQALDQLCEGADGFFHVAGWYKLGHRNPAEGWQVNVEGTHGAVVDETYRFTGEHLSVYDETKAAAHDVARDFAANGLPVVTVMPGLVYGPGDTSQTGALITQAATGKRVLAPSGGGVCWAHVDDIAAGHLLRSLFRMRRSR